MGSKGGMWSYWEKIEVRRRTDRRLRFRCSVLRLWLRFESNLLNT
jgi:hypothetical protein